MDCFRHIAKVRVAGSNPVIRSICACQAHASPTALPQRTHTRLHRIPVNFVWAAPLSSVPVRHEWGTLWHCSSMGTEFVVEGDSEPIFEIDDDMEWAIGQVNGWIYIEDGSEAAIDFTGFIVPANQLSRMADLCDVLAEQYGDEARTFIYERPASYSDDPLGHHPHPGRPLPITGPELGLCLHEMAEAVRTAIPLGRSLRVDNGVS